MGRISVGKSNFYKIIIRAREQAYTRTTLKNSFLATGIVPLNTVKVHQKFGLLSKENTPEHPSEVVQPTTPKTPRTLRRYTKELIENPDNSHGRSGILHLSHAAESATAERDIKQVELQNLQNSLQLKGRPNH